MKPFLRKLPLLLLTGVLLCYTGFVNSFPLLYADTGTYIRSGFTGEVPVDRPIFYGLFIRHVSMGVSLWSVILVQGFLTAYLIHLTFSLFFNGRKLTLAYLFTVTLLVLVTGLSWNVSILLPDIFTALGFLAILNMLIHKKLNYPDGVLLSFILFLSLATHTSNILVLGSVGLTCGVFWLFRKWKKKESPTSFKRLSWVAATLAASLILIPFLNVMHGSSFRISKGGHVFRINHMIELGVLQKFLKKNCDKEHYSLCDYPDGLNPSFMWDWNVSPLYKTGGWEANEEEYNLILSRINKDPELLLMVLRKNMGYSLKQFFLYDVEPPEKSRSDYPPIIEIQRRFPDLAQESMSSRQAKDELKSVEFSQKIRGINLLCIAFLFYFLLSPYFRRRFSPELRWAAGLVILLAVLNAYFCASFSTPVVRYQNRIIWLLPMMTIIILITWFTGTPLWVKIRETLGVQAAVAGLRDTQGK